DVALRKAKRLEVREAPIAFAQRRLHVNRTTVCRHGVLEPGSGLQGVAITHPNLRLPWMSREYRFINDDRVGVVAEVGQNRRLQVQVIRIARLLGEQALHLRQRRLRLRLAIEDDGIIVARGIETRSEMET